MHLNTLVLIYIEHIAKCNYIISLNSIIVGEHPVTTACIDSLT